MFRANRGRLIGIVITIFVVYFLFTSSTDSEFKRRTEKGLARKHGVLRGDLSDEALTQQTNDKLQGIINKQKEGEPEEPAAIREGLPPAVARASNKPSEDEDDVSVAGRKSMSKSSKDSSKPKYPVDKEGEDQKAINGGKPAKAAGGSGDPAKDIAREKLQQYLKTPSKSTSTTRHDLCFNPHVPISNITFQS